MQTNAAALGAAATYVPVGWPRALAPVIAVIDRTGAVGPGPGFRRRITVRSSPGFGSFPPGPEHEAAVMVGGRRVGLIAVKFGIAGSARFWRISMRSDGGRA